MKKFNEKDVWDQSWLLMSDVDSHEGAYLRVEYETSVNEYINDSDWSIENEDPAGAHCTGWCSRYPDLVIPGPNYDNDENDYEFARNPKEPKQGDYKGSVPMWSCMYFAGVARSMANAVYYTDDELCNMKCGEGFNVVRINDGSEVGHYLAYDIKLNIIVDFISDIWWIDGGVKYRDDLLNGNLKYEIMEEM